MTRQSIKILVMPLAQAGATFDITLPGGLRVVSLSATRAKLFCLDGTTHTMRLV